MGITLDRKTVAQLTLPDGKTEHFFWDDVLKGFSLRLRVGHDGKLMRSWYVTYRLNGKQYRPKLADVAKLNADQARKRATEMLAKVVLGIDPIENRDAAPKVTLRSAIDTYLAGKEREVVDGSYRPNSLRATRLYLTGAQYFGPLHRLDVNTITRAHVAQRLAVIREETSDVTAGRARAALAAFFTRSMQEGICESNPTIGTRPQAEKPQRDRVLSDDELRTIWNALPESDFGRAVKLLMLTGARRSEIGGLRWSEIHDDAIHLPAERCKNGRAHTVPITDMMRTVLESIPQRVDRDLVFGERAEVGLTAFQHGKADLRDGCAAWRLHDCRRTLATGLGNLGVRPDTIELVLNHAAHRGGISGVYNKSVYVREVRNALALWSDHVRSIITGTARKVVAFQQSA
jgi:integrase